MQRLKIVREDEAAEDIKRIYGNVEKGMGKVPNIIKTMANSKAVLEAYLGFNQALASSAISQQLKEKIALAVADSNGCSYCSAAHTVLAGKAGISPEDIERAREASSDDPKEDSALKFAKLVVEKRARVSDDDVAYLKKAGCSDGEIAEIVAATVLNIFTNYFNHVADTEVDF